MMRPAIQAHMVIQKGATGVNGIVRIAGMRRNDESG